MIQQEAENYKEKKKNMEDKMKKIGLVIIFIIPISLMAQETNTEQTKNGLMIKDIIREKLNNDGIIANIIENRYLEFEDNLFNDDILLKISSLTSDIFQNKYIDEKISNEGEGEINQFHYYINRNKSRLTLHDKIGTYGYVSENSKISIEQLEDIVMRDLETLGFEDNDQTLDIQLTRAMRAGVMTEENGSVINIPGEAISYTAYIHRYINEMPVYGQRMILEYYLDGIIKYLSFRWPKIENRTHILNNAISEDDIVERINNAIENSTLYQYGDESEFKLALRVENGALRHILLAFKKPSDETNAGSNRHKILEIPL